MMALKHADLQQKLTAWIRYPLGVLHVLLALLRCVNEQGNTRVHSGRYWSVHNYYCSFILYISIMHLDYYNEKTVDGIRYQFAHPTSQFWGAWNKDAARLASVGISLTHILDDRGSKIYTVVRASRPDSNNIPAPVKVAPYIIRDAAGLKKYQVPAVGGLVAALLTHRVAVDGSDTGTGKTYTSIKTTVLSGLQPAIVCTKTGIYDWKMVCDFFNVRPVFICNWESCTGKIYRSEGYITKHVQPPNKYITMTPHEFTGKPCYKWHIPVNAKVVIIFDELHKANGDDTSSQRLVRAAQLQGCRIIGLSATMCDKLAKFRMLGSLLGIFKYEDFDDWLKGKGSYEDSYGRWESPNESELMLKINRYIFPNYGARVRKKDIPGFPPCQNIAKLYQIKKSDVQNKKFEALQKKIEEIETKKPKGGKFQILALRMQHRQIAESYKIPLLIDLAKEYIEAGHTVIIFTNFIETLEQIAKRLKTNSVICGGQKVEERRRVIENLKCDNERIAITNMQAGGTALDGLQDLTGKYPRIGLVCPTDDAVLLKQVIGRIDRTNSKSNSMNILVYSAGTIEEKVFANVHIKLRNIDTLNDGDLAEMETFKKE